MTQDEIIDMAENAEIVVSKHSVWTPEKKGFTYMGHTIEGDLTNLMQFAELIARQEREACAKLCDEIATEDGWEGGYAYRCVEAIRARGNHASP